MTSGHLEDSSVGRATASLLLELKKKYKDLSEEARGLHAILELTRGISSHLNLDDLLANIMEAAVTLTMAERGYLVLIEDGKPLVRAAHHLDMESFNRDEMAFSKSVVLHAVKTCEPMLSTDASDDERFAGAASVQLMSLRAIMAAPITDSEGTAIGVVYVDDPHEAGRFSPRSLRLLQGFADQASIAIQTARLHEHLVREEVRLRQMALAQTIQQDLLPKEAPPIGSLDIAWEYITAHEVGGDYFDFLELADGSPGIVIADVAGKGVPAALVMAMLRVICKTSASNTADPAEFIASMHNSLRESLSVRTMVTAMLVTFSDDFDSLKCVRAGHCPLGIVRASTGDVEWIEPQGVALGLLNEYDAGICPAEEVPLNPGDGVLLFTDGVTEARNWKGEQYGEERTAEYMKRSTKAKSREFVDGLVAEVNAFMQGAIQKDDITIVYAKRARA